jgi:hypothetical protein
MKTKAPYQYKIRSLLSDEVESLREELHRRLLREDVTNICNWETLNRFSVILESDPVSFHTNWIQPLLTEGLSVEVALRCIAESLFLPN